MQTGQKKKKVCLGDYYNSTNPIIIYRVPTLYRERHYLASYFQWWWTGLFGLTLPPKTTWELVLNKNNLQSLQGVGTTKKYPEENDGEMEAQREKRVWKLPFSPRVFLSLTSVNIGFDHQPGQGRQISAARATQGGECDDRPAPQ